MGRYLVGIDLGTTNSAIAYVDRTSQPRAGQLGLKTFEVTQLTGIGQTRSKALLPSFCYLPGEHDLPAGAIALPWNPSMAFAVGEFARVHGSKVPGRLVSSAKSWLSHTGVDRTAPLLPWTAPPDVVRISPLEASRRYLQHMVAAWDHAHPKDPLGEQAVVLTVPASFDDVARNLTADAAKQAGIKNVTLLEEPQAAFYCWLGLSPPTETLRVQPGMRCLVVDVGGGTSDFSLIRAGEETGELTFLREAVGDHLLLGGDNMDLALAKHVEAKLPPGTRLDAVQFGLLVQGCRQAKESLLGPKPPAEVSLTVMGRGRSVVASAIAVSVTAEDVRIVLLDGFLPQVSRDDDPSRGGRTGLQEMGLPYVADPAITKHLAAFLRRHLPEGGPDAILFNGGVFQPDALRNRLVDVMRPWYGPNWSPIVLANPSLDLAVAWGAAYLAFLKDSGGKRIGGGIPRSYYVGIETDAASAVVCVVPRGLEEGQEIALDQPELELALGQPVLFPLSSSTVRGDDIPGAVVRIPPEQLLQLPPLHTILRGGKRSGTKRVPVTLAARCTEIGTLELYCVGKEEHQRWRLEFNVRDVLVNEDASDATDTVQDVWPEDRILAGNAVIASSYRQGTPTANELTKQLETALEAGRGDWPTAVCRRLWETVESVAAERAKSGALLNRWYHLAGFTLRPGFGDVLDRYRVEQLWKLLNIPGAMTEGGADYWIMWRRVSGGLNGSLQNNLFTRLKPTLLPGKNKVAVKPGANEFAEMWRTAASLERLDSKTKEQLGDALLKQFHAPYAFWCLTRLGARRPLYGPLNAVLHPKIAEQWLAAMQNFTPANEHERLGWAYCMAELARRTGQRALDVDEDIRSDISKLLHTLTIPAEWVKMVDEIVEAEADDRSRMFGESLPIGLKLRS